MLCITLASLPPFLFSVPVLHSGCLLLTRFFTVFLILICFAVSLSILHFGMASAMTGHVACAVCGLPTSMDYRCKGCNGAIHWWESMDHDSLKVEGHHGAHYWLFLLGEGLL